MFITTLFVLALSLVGKDTTYSKVQCSNLFTNRVSHHYIPICAYILSRFPTLPPHSCARSITMCCARHLGEGCWARIKQQNSEHASAIECGSSPLWCWCRRQLDTEPWRLRAKGPACIGRRSSPHFHPHSQNGKYSTDGVRCQAASARLHGGCGEWGPLENGFGGHLQNTFWRKPENTIFKDIYLYLPDLFSRKMQFVIK